ncbi:amylo-alpha-1,6-glucosidase [Rosettibacter firmus]|uniref:amylo-alpha-1,6-glucosidase n=1 Tax=Rosettibacter firmus TaxID=3111522 RepID=UPI00336BCD03
MNRKSIIIIIVVFIGSFQISKSKSFEKIVFNKKSEIEVGSFYAGVEFHNSVPVPQRISFYYPVANSIDLSTDYWHRDTSYVMNLGLKFGEKLEWLNDQQFSYELTPYTIKFFKEDEEKLIEISYQFAKNKSAVVISYSITNNSNDSKNVELFTILALSFRTSHTYAIRNEIKTSLINADKIILAEHLSSETKNTLLYILNPGEKPYEISFSDSTNNVPNFKEFATSKLVEPPSTNLVYKKTIKPKEKFVVEQIIGTCKPVESSNDITYLINNYKKEINDYDNYILSKISDIDVIKSGDDIIDRTVDWSKTILEVNRHYLDGNIVPMPCPAEYNFYFTHDVLMTDYVAVKFDLQRVKDDLEFIIKHANSQFVIPHAYYWKDSTFVTEYANYDNWNNCWFIIVAAEYLKYSKDKKFIEKIYPYLEKSLSTILMTKGNDDLIWSYRPDWWDIGKNYGQRSYMTILAIKSIRSFIYISVVIETNQDKLCEYEDLADRIEKSLNEKLWSDNYNYLMNYLESNAIDEHYYCGSLLAAHFNLIDTSKIYQMIKTAENFIVDNEIGVHTVYPMDFDTLKNIWHFLGDEAGKKFYYLNGGIWFHSNAWYVLALISADLKNKAFDFIRNVMIIDGIINSPNGQPAMYEVRCSDNNNFNTYGKVDKPHFLWAAGWYLYTLYHLFLLKDNEWNIELNPYLLPEQKECKMNLNINDNLSSVSIKRNKSLEVNIDGKTINSFVLPENLNNTDVVNILLGELKTPFLKSTNSILRDIKYDNGNMKLKFGAFEGHKNKTTIVCKSLPVEIKSLLNNTLKYNFQKIKDGWEIEIYFKHNKKEEELIIKF